MSSKPILKAENHQRTRMKSHHLYFTAENKCTTNSFDEDMISASRRKQSSKENNWESLTRNSEDLVEETPKMLPKDRRAYNTSTGLKVKKPKWWELKWWEKRKILPGHLYYIFVRASHIFFFLILFSHLQKIFYLSLPWQTLSQQLSVANHQLFINHYTPTTAGCCQNITFHKSLDSYNSLL